MNGILQMVHQAHWWLGVFEDVVEKDDEKRKFVHPVIEKFVFAFANDSPNFSRLMMNSLEIVNVS